MFKYIVEMILFPILHGIYVKLNAKHLLLFLIQAWSQKHDQPLSTGSSIGVALTVVFNTGMVMEA